MEYYFCLPSDFTWITFLRRWIQNQGLLHGYWAGIVHCHLRLILTEETIQRVISPVAQVSFEGFAIVRGEAKLWYRKIEFIKRDPSLGFTNLHKDLTHLGSIPFLSMSKKTRIFTHWGPLRVESNVMSVFLPYADLQAYRIDMVASLFSLLLRLSLMSLPAFISILIWILWGGAVSLIYTRQFCTHHHFDPRSKATLRSSEPRKLLILHRTTKLAL